MIPWVLLWNIDGPVVSIHKIHIINAFKRPSNGLYRGIILRKF
jgi:hypothetical protein